MLLLIAGLTILVYYSPITFVVIKLTPFHAFKRRTYVLVSQDITESTGALGQIDFLQSSFGFNI
jgi:hypothetical protein